jgi:adenosylcobinamide kinase/adenosylcobinamide-phosphate guanylyltransferase
VESKVKRLIIGGAKSGKSARALELLMRSPEPRRMVVSGRPLDLSFRARILDHRAERNPGIEVREIGLELPEAVREIDAGGVLADSLDFWLFSWLGAGRTGAEAAERLRSAIDAARADEMILVSCEIGLGPLPADRETREFADALGALNRAAADACDETILVIAGRALKIG